LATNRPELANRVPKGSLLRHFVNLDAYSNSAEDGRISEMTDIENSVLHDASNKVVNPVLRIVVSFNVLLIALGFTETGARAGLKERKC
jgi:hypothetical protein